MKPWLRQLLLAVACALVLLTVLSLYLRPGFVMNMANQVWGCF
ncbi:hypothetical protein [Limnohabitans sp. JirII-31]|nr:hypothetical protein [Limnohabitans sp. JirII-31]